MHKPALRLFERNRRHRPSSHRQSDLDLRANGAHSLRPRTADGSFSRMRASSIRRSGCDTRWLVSTSMVFLRRASMHPRAKRWKVKRLKGASQHVNTFSISHFFHQFRSYKRLSRRKRSNKCQLSDSSLHCGVTQVLRSLGTWGLFVHSIFERLTKWMKVSHSLVLHDSQPYNAALLKSAISPGWVSMNLRVSSWDSHAILFWPCYFGSPFSMQLHANQITICVEFDLFMFSSHWRNVYLKFYRDISCSEYPVPNISIV
jgi:hypothetical protein